jgi:hypothetical protein
MLKDIQAIAAQNALRHKLEALDNGVMGVDSFIRFTNNLPFDLDVNTLVEIIADVDDNGGN